MRTLKIDRSIDRCKVEKKTKDVGRNGRSWYSARRRDEMNLLSSEFGSTTISTSDILSNKGINEAYSNLGEPALLFSSS